MTHRCCLITWRPSRGVERAPDRGARGKSLMGRRSPVRSQTGTLTTQRSTAAPEKTPERALQESPMLSSRTRGAVSYTQDG